MAIPITVPRLGWNMEQGVFVGWLKADGDTIRAGDALFTLEGEKAAEDVECLDAGILHIPATAPNQGDTVAVALASATCWALAKRPAAEKPSPVAVAAPTAVESAAPALRAESRSAPTSSPRARRIASELRLDWTHATGTGGSGRIRERDVRALANAVPQATAADSTRRLIAERMLASQKSTAPVTLTTTIDATALVRWRNERKATLGNGPIPSFTDLFVKLTAAALANHSALNSRWENGGVVPSESINIGIAVDTDAGLLVPVIRDVPSLQIEALSARSRDLIDRARLGKLSAKALRGGTFTVTSLGSFGIDAFTPIIHFPECAILGIGRIRRCPVVVADEIVIRDQATLSLTFDHRIVDGAPAARFLQTLTRLAESPMLLFDGDAS